MREGHDKDKIRSGRHHPDSTCHRMTPHFLSQCPPSTLRLPCSFDRAPLSGHMCNLRMALVLSFRPCCSSDSCQCLPHSISLVCPRQLLALERPAGLPMGLRRQQFHHSTSGQSDYSCSSCGSLVAQRYQYWQSISVSYLRF